MNSIPTDIINVLASSLDELLRSIEIAKVTLVKVSNPEKEHILTRLNTYVEMVHKQRGWLGSLSECLRVNNIQEAAMIIERINRMSEMIKDDARELMLMNKQPTSDSGM